jgi:ABC-type dipeptide/oligopeptide/nickel transport system ATPase component
MWHNDALVTPKADLTVARALLRDAGFSYSGTTLRDRAGHPVRFSILTNMGNSQRMKMATLIQHDLAQLGMEVSIVSLDFPALIDRLMQSQNYEACLLGLENVDSEPNAMMNIWLSSSPNHQWNPSEKSPETAWEAEIDAQMKSQGSSLQFAERKRAIDRVQQIVAAQQPFIYLVYPNLLYAISPDLEGVAPGRVQPGLTWAPEWLRRLSIMPGRLLSVNIRARYADTAVLEDVQFELAKGEILGVIGGSGAGKSTLVLALMGLLQWRGGSVCGQIVLDGLNLLSLPDKHLRTIRGKMVGLIPQSPMSSLNPAISIEKHFKESWKAHRSFDQVEFSRRVENMLAEVQLPSGAEFLRRRPREISVGQAQRVLIALTLLHNPPLIIADEPTSALDPLNQSQVLRLLQELNRKCGTAILYISHDLVSVLRLVDRIAVLHEGRIVEKLQSARLIDAIHPATKELLSTLPVQPDVIIRSRYEQNSHSDRDGYLALVK